MCKPFWSVHGLHGLREHRVNRSYRQVSQHIPSSISREKSCALPAPEVLLCVSLGLLVAFACKSGLTSGVTSPGFTRRVGRHPKSRKYKYKTKTVTRAHENTKYNNTYMYKFQKQTREIQMDPKIHIAGGRSGQIREGFFFCARACLCKYNKVGIARQDDVPNGAEHSL